MTATSSINWERVRRTHSVREEILVAMHERSLPASPKWLSLKLRKPLGNVSYHVKILVQQGVLILHSTRPVRGAVEHFYELAPEILSQKSKTTARERRLERALRECADAFHSIDDDPEHMMHTFEECQHWRCREAQLALSPESNASKRRKETP